MFCVMCNYCHYGLSLSFNNSLRISRMLGSLSKERAILGIHSFPTLEYLFGFVWSGRWSTCALLDVHSSKVYGVARDFGLRNNTCVIEVRT